MLNTEAKVITGAAGSVSASNCVSQVY